MFTSESDKLLGFDRINHWMTWLRSLGSLDTDRSFGNLLAIKAFQIPDDLLESMILQMEREFIRVSDVDRAINNLQMFFSASRSPLTLATLFQRDESALPILLQLFSASQHCSDLLIQSPDYFDHLRLTGGHPRTDSELKAATLQELRNVSELTTASRILRRIKHRETLRIAYGDIILGLPLETTTQQISFVADSICHAAYVTCRKIVDFNRSPLLDAEGCPVPMSVIAMGKLGGTELNYSSDIDLMFVYGDDDGGSNAQIYFDDLARKFTKLLSEATSLGSAYRVDLRLRPDGNSGTLTRSFRSMVNYYENRGRTWERQALLKARVSAGDQKLGQQFLRRLEPWVYQKFATQFQIESIRTLKRKIEHRSTAAGEDESDVKTGKGGIRDVEFVIQFMQLLHSANRPDLRTGNTLKAIEHLSRVDCLTLAEATLLQRNYRLLRQVEHRLQLMFDLQTHRIPDDELERRRLALRCGFQGNEQQSALDRFMESLDRARQTNRQILDHLLHQAFPEGQSINETISNKLDENDYSEIDLILDPDPDHETIQRTLLPYGFQQPEIAYRRLMELSHESCRFLSEQRCRHFFAAICGPLLQRISQTPNPSETLTELSRVADSLGNKAVLWELFSANSASMDMCVRLCAVAPYLTSILTGNPGMLDELMDSLLLEHLPNREQLTSQLSELLKGAEDPLPILHSFKDAMHLLVGVRDILGQGNLQENHRFLSDVAESCLVCTADLHYKLMSKQFGEPTNSDGQPLAWAIIALGKIGGREPNYHSDLDIAFVYVPNDTIKKPSGNNPSSIGTKHQYFFERFAAKVVKTLNHFGTQGRLYEVDCRLRPTGKSGVLATSLPQLTKYFAVNSKSDSGHHATAQLWERQALCKSRVISPCAETKERVAAVLQAAKQTETSRRELASSVHHMRLEMQRGASAMNLKRGSGGTIDIEFLIQLLQLIYGPGQPALYVANTIAAIQRLVADGRISSSDGNYLVQSYEFLRGIEARLRLLNRNSRHDFPEDSATRNKLAYLLDIPSVDDLCETLRYFMSENRRRFLSVISQYCDLPEG